MTLTQLSYAVAVDTHRHFSRAAEACGVSQPTLSTQLRKLERELGVEIFDRGRQPVEPTDLGARVLSQARAVLREAARLEEVVEEARGEVSGEFRIGMLPTLAPYVLPRFASDLAREHPEISLSVEEGLTDPLLERVETDRLDAALIATPVDSPGLLERPLYEEPFVGYVSEGHRLHDRDRLSRDDLSLDDLWILHEGHCFRDQVLRVCRDLERPESSSRPLEFESGNLETLIRLVDEGGGMTLLPELAVDGLTSEQRRRVRAFRGPPPSRVVRLVHGKTYLKRGMIEAFRDSLLASVPVPLRVGGSAPD